MINIMIRNKPMIFVCYTDSFPAEIADRQQPLFELQTQKHLSFWNIQFWPANFYSFIYFGNLALYMHTNEQQKHSLEHKFIQVPGINILEIIR
jgi:hypothetical protein